MLPAASHKIEDYESLLVALQDVLGVIVPDEQRSHFVERIEPLLPSYDFDSFAMLAESLLNGDAGLRSDVLNAITHRQPGWQISVEIKNILHKYIFAQLPEDARIWVVGCGQGQFAYSIAMELTNFNHKNGESKSCQIIATDVLQEDIKVAESGVYGMPLLTALSDENKKLYVKLDETAGNGQVKDKIKNLLSFSQRDVTDDLSVLGQMDLIICPELLMYFSNGIKAGVLNQFAELLKSGGIFLTGGSQIIPSDQGLERVDHSAGVFYRQKS